MTPSSKGRKAPVKNKRSFRVQPMAALSSRLLDRSIRRKGFVEVRIVRDWPSIAGAELAKVTVPLQVKFPPGKRSGATLVLRCASAFAPLAQHQEPRIVEMVNRYFGYPAVDRIIVRQGPVKTLKRPSVPGHRDLKEEEQHRLNTLLGAEGDKARSEIKDDLRASLHRLGAAILTRKSLDK